MKFLILATTHLKRFDSADQFIEVGTAAKEYVEQALETGILQCAYQFTDANKAVAIGNFQSLDAAMAFVENYPFYPYQEFEVHPIVGALEFLHVDLRKALSATQPVAPLA